MFQVNLANTANRKIVEQLGNITVFEYDHDLSADADKAMDQYYASKMNIKRRQALLQVNPAAPVTCQPGEVAWTVGQLQTSPNGNGVGDYAKQLLGPTAMIEVANKPIYQGNGLIMLSPVFKNLIIEDVGAWNGMLIEDDKFAACSASIGVSSVTRGFVPNININSTCLVGAGFVVLKSDYPRSELVEVGLSGDELKIDRNQVLAWSQSLAFSAEYSDDGSRIMYVFRGMGRVVISPV